MYELSVFGIMCCGLVVKMMCGVLPYFPYEGLGYNGNVVTFIMF